MIIFYKNIVKYYRGGVKRPSLIHPFPDNYPSPVENARIVSIPQGIFCFYNH